MQTTPPQKFWVYLSGRAYGPYDPRWAAGMPAFTSQTLVCPASESGFSPRTWQRAGQLAEFTPHLKVGQRTRPGNSPAKPLRIARRHTPADYQALASEMQSMRTRVASLGNSIRNDFNRLHTLRSEWAQQATATITATPQRPSLKTAPSPIIPATPLPPIAAPAHEDIDLEAPPGSPTTGNLQPPPTESIKLSPRSTVNDSRYKKDQTKRLRRAVRPLKWLAIAGSLIFSTIYIVWRATSTLNYGSNIHTAVSLTLLFAEIYGFISMSLYFLQTRDKRDRHPIEIPETDMPTADVFVTIYDEPADILFRTLVGCRALDYPKDRLNIYVLDDGVRPEIAKLAKDMGVHYIPREETKHAKAGNLNYAFKRTSGQLILVLDTDHVPVRSMLRETAGFFTTDEKVAFVQMPHHFYNEDCFQRNLHLEGNLVNEQDLFFQVIMPGRDRSNSAIFAGSSAVFRREALDEIDGFKVESAIEDLYTGMELQARGWKGHYYNRVLSGALSPENFNGYLTQRNRWSRGGVQIFILDNPLFKRGFTLAQRLNYFASLFYFFHGWPRLVYLLAPLAFLVFDYNPIVADVRVLITFFLPHYLLAHLAFAMSSREFRNPFWSDVYEAAVSFAVSWEAFKTFFIPESLSFGVTPKGDSAKAKKERLGWSFVLPHLILMILLLTGIVIATNEQVTVGGRLDAYFLSLVWAVFNLILLGAAVEVARERPHKRRHYRIDRSIPCELVFAGKTLGAKTKNISESGMRMQLDSHEYLPPETRVHLFARYGEITEVEGEIVRNEWLKNGRSDIGIRFHKLSEPVRRSIIRQMFSAEESWDKIYRPQRSSLQALGHIASSTVRPRIRTEARPQRRWPRLKHIARCQLRVADHIIDAETRDISSNGASVLAPTDDRLPAELTLRIPLRSHDALTVRAEVLRPIRREGAYTLYALRFTKPERIDLSLFHAKTSEPAS
jgi:cellulose synthase (UDP-forming)